jgi:large subunit ribosomal protein L24
MNIKKGDKVIILAGKDKGKTGTVLQVFPDRERASVEGLNLLIKHMRPRREGEKGQRIEFPAPLCLSNLMLVCPKCDKPSRIAMKMTEGEKGQKKFRSCKRCGQIVD